MDKKTYFVLSCAVLLMLFSASPALAGFGDGPGAPSAIVITGGDDLRSGSWIQDLFAWVERTFGGAEEDRILSAWEASKKGGDDPEESEYSDPGTGVSPMAGPEIDPDG